MLRVFFLILLATASTCRAQTLTSTLRGSVRDFDTNQPLAGATIQLIGTEKGTVSDAAGNFRFDELPTGRYNLSVAYLGYETNLIPEILLESGKEKVVGVSLKQAGKQLEAAIVRSNRPIAYNSIQTITPEQTLRYAATYLDPARLAVSFPGVATANDQANGLVIRGNTPNGMQWRLEGVEIVNPNHTSNAGTFSDRATQTGGGVNILSTQLMGDSYFLTGAFPAEYGNALSGVMDMRLRKGNDEKQEFTAQAGLIGFDLAAEGPFSRNSKASYLVNYRYSFTGLLGALGVTFGGEDIRYQDLSFNLSLPTEKAGEFTVFGMGGASSNIFKASLDTSEWVFQKDGYDIDFRSKMGALGVTHTLQLSKKTGLKTVLVASALENSRNGYLHSIDDPRERTLTEQDANRKTRISFTTAVSHRLTSSSLVKAGTFLTYQADSVKSISGSEVAEGRLRGLIIQPYVSWQWQPTLRITTDLGLHYLHYTYNNTQSLEPRASVRFQADQRNSFSLSYGLHSQLQQPQVYLSYVRSGTGQLLLPNTDLSPTRSHHLVGGYQYSFGTSGNLKVEAYLQNTFNVPVYEGEIVPDSPQSLSFSALNLVEGFVNLPLKNTGTGRNYGIEVSYNKYLTDDFYLMVSGSLYDATYVAADGVRRNTRYNGNHTFSLTSGREFRTQKNGIWGINTRLIWLGGFGDTPINVDASRTEGRTIYTSEDAFSIKMKDYFRPDLRIYWKKNHPRYSRTIALDIQNVSGTQNQAYSYYDALQRQLVQKYQLGLIPILSYRWEF
ncbi:TonB-dependent receptor [Persicitalea jodogahamensis]|uniref:Prevent-host-death protein n=1 Tax=Persicitalea jodogahamensis TaxID=402147 RepID=A0A8J3D9L0_9BACT|nr:TonB-dependent receptor [Persicitalea jodogahamensis]GHB64912.1 prevent-host-death protein [Persicitalea jodogahamensis]